MTDPTVITVEHADTGGCDPVSAAEIRERSVRRIGELPLRYQNATASSPEVVEWVRTLVNDAVRRCRNDVAVVRSGPSLLLLGSTGTGKTYQAYGAIRAVAASGVQCHWQYSTAADLYAAVRPRARTDSEDEFHRFASCALLVLDDLGAAKGSEWTEEINYRLINHRYERMLPTLITSNVPVHDLGDALGDRVASRLAEMTTRAVLTGPDRRRGA